MAFVSVWFCQIFVSLETASCFFLINILILSVTGFEASEDKAYKEPLLTDPDEPPPEPVVLAEPASVTPVTLECSEPTYTEYPEPGQPGCTGRG